MFYLTNMFSKYGINNKFLYLELLFFAFMAYVSSIISDLEYSFYEEHNILKFTDVLEYRFVVGTYSFMFYSCYYWLFLKRFVYEKKIFYILLSAVCFIFTSHLYDKYVMYGSISKFNFVSNGLRSQAKKEFFRPGLDLTVNYLLVAVVMPIIGFSFLVRSMSQDEQLKELKEQQLISELNYLKSQLHPHFFFNTLNNIYALALKQSKNTAPMIEKLGELMRYILYEASQPKVLLKKEITFLQNYTEVEKIRHSNNDIRFESQGFDQDMTIEPLLLLPFIENAFKHGLEEELYSGFVHIIVCVCEHELILDVKNSKPLNKFKVDYQGIGLSNIRKRLEILYLNKYQLDIVNDPTQHSVTLTLQIA